MAELADYLTSAWNFSVSPKHGAPSVGDCAADVSIEELRARRRELLMVRDRDHVARVKLAFIDRVLASKA